MTREEQPVGVFDSGVGGISVLKELAAELPHENFRYFGDSANAPYGTKSTEEVLRLAEQVTDRLIAEGAKAIVIACNTATSAAADYLREKYDTLPIVGIEPALKPAALAKEHARILVMATPVTLRLGKFRRLLDQYGHNGVTYLLPCPGLVELVEAGEIDSERTEAYLRELLNGHLPGQAEEVDSVVLGCTHYPFVKRKIQKLLGDEVQIFDGARGTARELRRRMQVCGILNQQSAPGTIEFGNSRNTEEEIALCKWLFENG